MDFKDRILSVEGRNYEGGKISRDSTYRKSAESWIRFYGCDTWWSNRTSWENALLHQYSSYLDTREGSWLISHRYNDDECVEEILSIPWYCRHSNIYKKRVFAQLRPLYGLKEKLCIHLVLTTAPRQFTHVIGAVHGLKCSWKKLHDVLYRKHGKFPYLATIEISKKHHLPHLHILIFGIPWLMNVFDILDKWKKYDQGSHVRIKKMDYKRGLKEVTKYIFKQVDDDLLGAILWVTRSRSYMCSRGLLRPMSVHDPKTWVPSGYKYIGLVDGWKLEDFLFGIDADKSCFNSIADRSTFRIKDPPIDWDLLLDVRLREIYW